MGRTWALMAVLVTWAASGGVWASVEDLPVEHRAEDLTDILSDLPVASSDMFIWNNPDGSYRFGMQGDDQWRVESRDTDGTVKGRYTYRTPEGQVVDITYDAGPQGYRARGDVIPGGAAPLQPESPQIVLKHGFGTPEKSQLVPTRYSEQTAVEEKSQLVPPRYSEQTAGELPEQYGAILLVGVEETHPSGGGVTTYSDDDNLAIVTDVKFQPLQEGPVAVFPVGFLPGTTHQLAGPPLVNDFPVQPAAIPV